MVPISNFVAIFDEAGYIYLKAGTPNISFVHKIDSSSVDFTETLSLSWQSSRPLVTSKAHHYILSSALNITLIINGSGLRLNELDLGYNALRRVPGLALAQTKEIDKLVLDGNMFLSLETGSFRRINVKTISVSVA